ncbi:hypothetical protein [Labrys wisconsinensis]|uniref:DUF3329 domain-containing protein n=1 Tax=Labrys wisconsinensis TaxID=425677 RepID=A0ABU0JN79_9HYPH|nr:hypothetical protein [Labrys wisconsinensis]MDQ0474853.1 hypothetical protein [Labrys wisconsinensis]
MAKPQQPVPNWMKPLWVRLAFVIAPAAWAAMEALNGQTMWAAMFGAAALWGLWTLVVKFEPDDTSKDGTPEA